MNILKKIKFIFLLFSMILSAQENDYGIKFTSKLPQNINISCKQKIPKAKKLKAIKKSPPPTITFSETKINSKCPNSYQLKRTWTATDEYGNSKSHTQIINISDDEPPVFTNKSLPQNINIRQGEKIPNQTKLFAKDNCSKKVEVIPSKENHTDENGNLIKITYKWEAKDDCGNSSFHIQNINIAPAPEIKFNNPPKNIKKENKGQIYPNPINDIFYLKNFKNIQNIKIFNASRRLIKQFYPQPYYNISSLNRGIYFIFIKSENGLEKFKVIKL